MTSTATPFRHLLLLIMLTALLLGGLLGWLLSRPVLRAPVLSCRPVPVRRSSVILPDSAGQDCLTGGDIARARAMERIGR